MRRGALILLAIAAVLLGMVGPATAQQPRVPAGPAGGVAATSPLADLTAWIVTQQRSMHRELVRAMRGLSGSNAPAAVYALILGSFLYGVFHPVGPGHGKAIIATYLATQPYRIPRGLWLSAAGAYAQPCKTQSLPTPLSRCWRSMGWG